MNRSLIPCITLMAAALIQAARADITIYRDSFGTPSIVASKLEDAEFGLGYATAADNAERMALNYKQARGRLAEVQGRGQLLTDGFIRALGIEDMAEAKARTMTGDTKAAIEAFCAGANRALTENKAKIPAWIQPFNPTDVLAFSQLVNAAFPLQEIAAQLLPGTGSNQ